MTMTFQQYLVEYCVKGLLVLCVIGMLLMVVDILLIERRTRLRQKQKRGGVILCNERGIHDCICDACTELRDEIVSR